jgi:hypothetical protein
MKSFAFNSGKSPRKWRIVREPFTRLTMTVETGVVASMRSTRIKLRFCSVIKLKISFILISLKIPSKNQPIQQKTLFWDRRKQLITSAFVKLFQNSTRIGSITSQSCVLVMGTWVGVLAGKLIHINNRIDTT